MVILESGELFRHLPPKTSGVRLDEGTLYKVLGKSPAAGDITCAATLSGSATVTSACVVTRVGASDIAGVSSVSCDVTRMVSGEAALASSGTVAADAVVVRTCSVSIGANSALQASSMLVTQAHASLEAGSTVSCAATAIKHGSAELVAFADATLTANVSSIQGAQCSLEAFSTLETTIAVQFATSAELNSVGYQTTKVSVLSAMQASLAAEGSLISTGSSLAGHGGPGIDTEHERQHIKYSPVLEYIKELQPPVDVNRPYEFTPSTALSRATVYTPMVAIESVKSAKKTVDEAIDLLSRNLQDATNIPTDVLGAVKAYTGKEYISIDDYRRACNEDTTEAQQIVKIYQGSTGTIEALLYPDCVELKSDLADQEIFIEDCIIDVMRIAGYDLSNGVEAAVTSRIAEWANLENVISYMCSQITTLEDQDSAASLQRQLYDASKVYVSYVSDPTPILSKLVIQRATTASSIAERVRGLVTRTVAETLDYSVDAFIERIFMSIDVSAIDTYRAKLAEVRNVIGSIRKILRLASVSFEFTTQDIIGIALSILAPFVRTATNQVLSYISKQKAELMRPVFTWLSKAYEDPLFSLLPLDRLATTIMDVVDGIEAKFNDAVLDCYRLTQSRSIVLSNKLDILEKRDWLTKVIDVLDKFEQALCDMSPEVLEGVLARTLDPRPYIQQICARMGWLDGGEY